MEKTASCFELRTMEGKPIFQLIISEIVKGNSDPGIPGKSDPKDEKKNNGNAAEDARMTDAQKRYLFRILADQGIQGDKALEHLTNLFQVDSLKEVTKLEASKAIESMLEDAKGGGKSGSSF